MAEPLYAHLLLDVSASMSGAPLEALKQGVHLLNGAFATLGARPIRVSMIAYESTASVIMPLTEVRQGEDFQNSESLLLHTLEAAGSSNLGGAFRLLARTMPVHRPTLVYVFTDGEPTDDWEAGRDLVRPRVQRLFGLACGLAANKDILDAIVDEAFWLGDLTADRLAGTFRAFAAG